MDSSIPSTAGSLPQPMGSVPQTPQTMGSMRAPSLPVPRSDSSQSTFTPIEPPPAQSSFNMQGLYGFTTDQDRFGRGSNPFQEAQRGAIGEGAFAQQSVSPFSHHESQTQQSMRRSSEMSRSSNSQAIPSASALRAQVEICSPPSLPP